MEEHLLWQSFKQGDLKAFEKIYRLYSGKLFAYGMSVLRNRPLIKDAIHELFLDLWQHRKNLSSEIHLQFYLYKGLRRKILHLSKNKNNHFLIIEDTHENMVSLSNFSFETELINEQSEIIFKQQFSKIYNNLPVRQKEVLQLLYIQNLSNEEVARIMDINIESVYTLNWKALNNLRRQFKDINLKVPL